MPQPLGVPCRGHKLLWMNFILIILKKNIIRKSLCPPHEPPSVVTCFHQHVEKIRGTTFEFEPGPFLRSPLVNPNTLALHHGNFQFTFPRKSSTHTKYSAPAIIFDDHETCPDRQRRWEYYDHVSTFPFFLKTLAVTYIFLHIFTIPVLILHITFSAFLSERQSWHLEIIFSNTCLTFYTNQKQDRHNLHIWLYRIPTWKSFSNRRSTGEPRNSPVRRNLNFSTLTVWWAIPGPFGHQLSIAKRLRKHTIKRWVLCSNLNTKKHFYFPENTGTCEPTGDSRWKSNVKSPISFRMLTLLSLSDVIVIWGCKVAFFCATVSIVAVSCFPSLSVMFRR